MKNYLGDIAEIQSWYYVRTSTDWDVIYLQAKDFDEFGDIKWDLKPELNPKEVQERQYLQDWDILYSAKWTRNFATVYKKEYWKCVASSTFFIIRLHNENIIPEYLAILLTEASKWKYFQDNISWWYIQSISKPVLQNYEIETPPLNKQKDIIKYYEIYKKQIKLYDKLKEKKEMFTNQIILQSNTLNND